MSARDGHKKAKRHSACSQDENSLVRSFPEFSRGRTGLRLVPKVAPACCTSEQFAILVQKSRRVEQQLKITHVKYAYHDKISTMRRRVRTEGAKISTSFEKSPTVRTHIIEAGICSSVSPYKAFNSREESRKGPRRLLSWV